MSQYFTEYDVRNALEFDCIAVGSQGAWAKKNNLMRNRVSEILSGKRPPTVRVCLALGFRKIVVYEKIEDRAPKPLAKTNHE